MVFVDRKRCVGCAMCVPFCSVGAIACFGVAHVGEACNECLLCLESCPLKALREGKAEGEGDATGN